ncbi:helix-turn-helix domain-containing protein [Streptomyces sp. NBC_01353]|uniref:helix-turn-helix domain-containing protein n=1 Tax=Streptomyces sp. NBC_01353 TaxID=2903835 RepID=UPI002E328A22|nr:helix-turn-helix domain-containing protein [Streptomyces sp. NBC_01353]
MVPAVDQWISTTTGRIAPDPYSWMQAVHWVGGSGLYTPSRQHGPNWGPTTVVIAQEMSALAECRPGVDYLARKLCVSERTVQYHLDMLREAGLLVYRSKGTRAAGRVRLASVYERVIPAQFDEALGIRTVLRDEDGPAYARVPVGIAEQGRALIGKLAKKAARKVRRKRSRTPRAAGLDCTPMQVGTSTVPTAGALSLPSEGKLASGKKVSPTPKQQKPKARKLNKVGRRHQLARELITAVPWLRQAAVARIAWVVRHVADAGWSVLEVRAFLALAETPEVRRPSALLAHRLKGAHQLWTTNAQRTAAVEAWHHAEEQARKARIAAVRTAREETRETLLPKSAVVQRALTAASNAVHDWLSADGEATVHGVEDGIALEDLPRDEVLKHRRDAERDLSLIRAALDCGMSERDARRLYTNRLVDQALRTTLSPAF